MTGSSTSSAGDEGGSRPSRKAATATVLVFGSRLFRSFGRVLVLVAVARAFSVDEVADFAFYFTLGSLVGLAADGGLTEYVGREIAAAGLRHPWLERKALLIRCSTFLLSFVLALLLLLATQGAAGLQAVGPLLAGSGFVLLDYLSATARANARYDLDLTYNAIFCAVLVACLGGTYFLRLPYASFQLTLGVMLPGALLVVILQRLKALSAASDRAGTLSGAMLFKRARWFLLRSIIVWCFSDLPIVLLRYLSTSLQVSLFSLAMRSVGFVTQVFVVIGFVFYPALANARSVSQARFLEKSVALTLINTYVMPAAFVACLSGGWILIAVSGDTYRDAWAVLQLLALAHVLNQGGFTGSSLIVAGMERQIAKLMMAALVVFTAAALLSMRPLGVRGAVAALLASFVVAKLGLWALYRRAAIPVGGRAFLVPFSAFGAVLLVSLFLPLPVQIAVLLPLALLSVVLTVRTLRRIAIF